ncbi:MAG: FkbM family methyltransferase [Holosporaceae bacterium]|jgi:FkbM family methyltransferase|nr:FkbM family methyltransferase [Holosporaceae bacterium]
MKKRTEFPSLLNVVMAVVLGWHIYATNDKIEELFLHVSHNLCDNTVCQGQANALACEIFHKYAVKKFDALKDGVDAKSCEILDYALKCMENECFIKKTKFEYRPFSFPAYQWEHLRQWENELKVVMKKYNLLGEGHTAEAFYFHHGLRFSSRKIQDYVQNKDIIDCGAFIGDSLLALRKYTNKTIYCYEFSKPNAENFLKVMAANKITSGYRLINKALGESVRQIKCNAQRNDGSSSIEEGNGGDVVDMTSIDAEVKKYNINVGFIKMDVEGYGLPIIKGAINVIKTQRPVLSLAIYHNSDELFQIKPFLQKHLTDYVYEFRLQGFRNRDFLELTLICYPKEQNE